MMKKNSHDVILNTILSIKNTEYPDIPDDLIKQLIWAEHENTDNFSSGLRDVRKLVDQYLKEI